MFKKRLGNTGDGNHFERRRNNGIIEIETKNEADMYIEKELKERDKERER